MKWDKKQIVVTLILAELYISVRETNLDDTKYYYFHSKKNSREKRKCIITLYIDVDVDNRNLHIMAPNKVSIHGKFRLYYNIAHTILFKEIIFQTRKVYLVVAIVSFYLFFYKIKKKSLSPTNTSCPCV